jgi:hypothetical protein
MKMDLHIKIIDINVTELTATSGIFSGENYHADWSAMNKTNTGLELRGKANFSKNCLNFVSDSDSIHMRRVGRDLNDNKQVRK